MSTEVKNPMRSLDLSLYDNSWYQCGRPMWMQVAWFLFGAPLVRSAILPGSGFRRWILRCFGAKIGHNVVIKPGVRIKYPWRLQVGDHSWIGEDCWIDNVDQVTIGSHACVSQGVYLCTGGHAITDPAFGLLTRPIVIEDRAWIAARAMVAPGVIVREGAVVTMGSVISGSLGSCTVSAGNPARSVGSRSLSDSTPAVDVNGSVLKTNSDAVVADISVPPREERLMPKPLSGDPGLSWNDIAEEIRAQIRSLSSDSPRNIRDDQWATAYGLDSLALLVFRENCEAKFSVKVTDVEWVSLASCEELTELIWKKLGHEAAPPQERIERRADPMVSSPKHWNNNVFAERLEVGMPLTGINGLAETPLLKYLGDLRWRHIAQISGVPSRAMIDEEKNRLYATFFYVEISFPLDKPMSSYGENDEFTIIASLKRYGTSILDGTAILVADHLRESTLEPFPTIEAANAAGMPAIRLSNIFVMQFNGAEWLRKSRPREGLIENIEELEQEPESRGLLKKAASGMIEEPDSSWTPMSEVEHEYHYGMQPDRDVNGAGLLYFANYPTFLDLAEREALKSSGSGYTDDLVNTRSLVNRKLAYINNASWRHTLRIRTRLFTRRSDGAHLIRSEQVMHRESDDRLMCVSTSIKRVSPPTVNG